MDQTTRNSQELNKFVSSQSSLKIYQTLEITAKISLENIATWFTQLSGT